MRSKFTICLAALLFALPVLAENPRIPNDINFELPASDTQWHIVTKQNNTPVLRFYTYQGTSAWSSLGWTPKFKYSKTDSSTSMAEIAGVSYTNYIDFQATTNTFPYAVEKWYCTVLLSTGILDISQASGMLSVERSPELTAGTLVYASPLINWASYTFTNTTRYGPYLAGSNMVLRDVGTNGQFYFDAVLTNYIDFATYTTLTNAVTNTIIKLIAVSNDTVSARTVADAGSNEAYNARIVADAGSNLAYTAWGWGNHALVGYLTAGSNVSSLINDAAYTNNTVTNGLVAWALSQFYPSNNPDAFISSNGITAWALLYAYPSNNPNSFISSNGITAWADSKFYPSNNPNSWVDQTVTNNLAAWILSWAYPSNNPNAFITDAAITGLSNTQTIHSAQIGSNQLAITGHSNTQLLFAAQIGSNQLAITGHSTTNASLQAQITTNRTDITSHSNRTDNPHTVTLQQAANAGQSVTNKYITIGNLVLDSTPAGFAGGLLHPSVAGENLYLTTDTNYFSTPTNPTIKFIANVTPEIFLTSGTSDDGYFYFAAGTNGYFRFGNMNIERFRIAKTYIDFKTLEATNISTAYIGTDIVQTIYSTNLNYNTAIGQMNVAQYGSYSNLNANTNNSVTANTTNLNVSGTGLFQNISLGTNASTARLNLPKGTEASDGISFGGDTPFYRSEANVITFGRGKFSSGILCDTYYTYSVDKGITFSLVPSASFSAESYYDGTIFWLITNSAGTIIFNTGYSSATTTNALQFNSGSNRMDIGAAGTNGANGPKFWYSGAGGTTYPYYASTTNYVALWADNVNGGRMLWQACSNATLSVITTNTIAFP